MTMYIDAHLHIYKLFENRNRLLNIDNYKFIGVSDDIISSNKTIKLSILYENIIPAIGVHPWNADKVSKIDLKIFYNLVKDNNVKILGEIGLDKKFTPQTYEKQLETFEFFLNLAKEFDLSLNLHTPNTWDEVLNLLLKYDIKKAYFHWYGGDIKTLEEITKYGYYIGINVASLYNSKYLDYINYLKIENILTESDSPYIYKGKELSYLDLEKLYEKVSEKFNININQLIDKLNNNLSKFLI